jgi:hypothetical protein
MRSANGPLIAGLTSVHGRVATVRGRTSIPAGVARLSGRAGCPSAPSCRSTAARRREPGQIERTRSACWSFGPCVPRTPHAGSPPATGPARDAAQTGGLAQEFDLADCVRWPWFAPAAVQVGVGALFAFPVHVGATTIGVLELYRRCPPRCRTRAGGGRRGGGRRCQFQAALNSRILIEQPKDVLAERGRMDMGAASTSSAARPADGRTSDWLRSPPTSSQAATTSTLRVLGRHDQLRDSKTRVL